MNRSEWSRETKTDDTNGGYRRTPVTAINARRTVFSAATGGFGIVDTPSSWNPRACSNLPGADTPSAACPNLDPTSLRDPGSRLVLRNRAPALTAAAHGNETAALSLFEQPFCSGVQGAKVTLLRVGALRRIAKSSSPTVDGQRIDRTGDLVAAKYNEERAGADTGGLSGRRVVRGTLREVTVRHHGRLQTIVSGPAATR